ncbi:hypothetical protein B0H16DRAFT_869645 [Mycena metata]|uniref:BTB domain-containing protein n=1 Tax=Mycena metata TaxID=1033252 RepID=A0AAD7IUZ7_9AGAR|nr:hypothetical protein B0H16DRAFT_869645 [Mycena metata]
MVPQRDADLWFLDGNLIVQSELLSFRIYGGLLANESPIFKDMLSIPQPANEAKIDGCPVVYLHDDPRDLKCFLRALFDYRFFPPYPAPTDFDTIAGVTRLSKKYEVDGLLRRALVHLASGFPMSVDEYSNPDASWPIIGNLRVLTFARELSIDWILPVAFYRACAGNTIKDILHGERHRGVLYRLAHEDRLLCLEQSQALRGAAAASVCDFLWNPTTIEGCKDPDGCIKNRTLFRRHVEDWRWNKDILPLRLWEEDDWDTLEVCKYCLTAMRVTRRGALLAFWDGLPKRFGIAPWPVLIKTKTETLQ